MSVFEPLDKFEKAIAEYFNAPYAIATDCCTHALELCIQLNRHTTITCPKHTYVSVPFMLKKINCKFVFQDIPWKEYYYLTDTIVDAAVLWRKNSYIPGTKMCLSFHFKKHLNIGRGGMILLDNKIDYEKLQKMRYDGRSIYNNVNYDVDDIKEIGYHYYMTPETALEGLKIFNNIKDVPAKSVTYADYKDLTTMTVFKLHL